MDLDLDLDALWKRASAVASDAAAAASAQADALSRGDFASTVKSVFDEIRANTVATAEAAEGHLRADAALAALGSGRALSANVDPSAYGVTPEFMTFVGALTPETFASFPLEEEEEEEEEEDDDADDPRWTITAFRETHARLVMRDVPAANDVRRRLISTNAMSDANYWRAYFALCANKLADAERAHDARIAEAREARERFRREAAAAAAAAGPRAGDGGGEGGGGEGGGDADGPAAAAAALAAEMAAAYGDDDDDDAGGDGGGGAGDGAPPAAAGEDAEEAAKIGEEVAEDLEAYLRDMLVDGGSDEDEDDEDEDEDGGSGVDVAALLEEEGDGDGDDDGGDDDEKDSGWLVEPRKAP